MVSTLPDAEYLPTGAAGYLTQLRGLLSPDAFLGVSPMGRADGEAILDAWLAGARRSLTGAQRSELLGAFAAMDSPSPLWLRTAFEQSARWRSFSPAEETRLPAERSVAALIGSFFEALKARHGAELVDALLGLITIAPLSLNELEDILSCDETVLNAVFRWWVPPIRRLPPLLVTRVLADIDSFLVKRQAGGTPVVTWYHRQWAEAATRAFLGREPTATALADVTAVEAGRFRQVAEYFGGVWSARPKPFPGWRMASGETRCEGSADRQVAAQPFVLSGAIGDDCVPNERVLMQLPRLYARAGMWTEFRALVCDLHFMQAKLTADAGEDLHLTEI